MPDRVSPGPGPYHLLFALTSGLKEYDHWMNDNECWEPGDELEKAVKGLAKAWKAGLGIWRMLHHTSSSAFQTLASYVKRHHMTWRALALAARLP